MKTLRTFYLKILHMQHLNDSDSIKCFLLWLSLHLKLTNSRCIEISGGLKLFYSLFISLRYSFLIQSCRSQILSGRSCVKKQRSFCLCICKTNAQEKRHNLQDSILWRCRTTIVCREGFVGNEKECLQLVHYQV